MKKRSVLLGGLFVLLIFTIFLPQGAFAQEDPCEFVRNCPVPAPTLVQIDGGASYYQDEFVIQGLSWNETKVDVYINDIYNGRANLIIDESGIGHFAYIPFLPLSEGKHLVYSVTRNLNERERSVESVHYEVFIKRKITLVPVVGVSDSSNSDQLANLDTDQSQFPEDLSNDQQLELSDDSLDSLDKTEEDAVINSGVMVVDNEDDSKINIAPEEDGRVEVLETGGVIEGGVSAESGEPISELQQTADRDTIINEFFSEDEDFIKQQQESRAKQNQQIGLAMLSVVLVIVVVWSIIGYRGKVPPEAKSLFDEDDQINNKNPKQEEFINKLEESKVEIIKDKEPEDEIDRLV